MSQYLESLRIGDKIDVRGPSGRLKYVGNGFFTVKNMRKDPPTVIRVKKINMIAGKFFNYINIANIILNCIKKSINP